MNLCHTNRLKWLVFCALLVLAVASSSSSPPPPRRRSRRLFSFGHAAARHQHDNANDDEHHITGSEPTQPETEKPLWKEDTASNKEQEPLLPVTSEEHSNEHDDDNHREETLHSHAHHHVSLLQVSCTLQVATSSSSPTCHSHKAHAVTTIVDTGAQVTVLSFHAAQTCGIAHLIDQRYAGQATGVGRCRVVGRIPAGALFLQFGTCPKIPSPAITVLEEHDLDVHLLLGLDFLRDYGAILSMEQDCMILKNHDNDDEEEPTVIPFLKPFHNDSKDKDFGVGWINKDILASLGGESSSSASEHYDDSDDEDGRDDEDYDDLDMSGV